MVSKIRIPEAIGTSIKRVAGMTALSHLVQHFIYSVDILLASNFYLPWIAAIFMPISQIKNRG